MAPSPQKFEALKTEPVKSAQEPGGELEQLRAENARLKSERDQLESAMAAGAKKALELKAAEPVSTELPEKYRGVKQYRVGPAGGYREGQHYVEGEIITLVDAVPSRTWTPHTARKAVAPPVEAESSERPSDMQV